MIMDKPLTEVETQKESWDDGYETLRQEFFARFMTEEYSNNPENPDAEIYFKDNADYETVLDWMWHKVSQALLSERARRVELLEEAKRKDTDPLHSYMPSVWNDSLDKAISIIKESR